MEQNPLFAKCKTTRIKDLNMGTRKVNLTQFHDLIVYNDYVIKDLDIVV